MSDVKKMVTKAKGVHIEFRLDELCVLITVVVTFAVCLSEKLGKIHVPLSKSA